MPCWWIRTTELSRMARSVKELEAWAELLELCDDDCQTFRTTSAMRSAVLEVERELNRLHKIEDCAIKLARLFKVMRDNGNNPSNDPDQDERWECAMQDLWENEPQIC